MPLYGERVISRRITVAQQTVAGPGTARSQPAGENDGSKPLNDSCAEAASCPSTTRPSRRTPGSAMSAAPLGHPLLQKQHLGGLWIAATATC